MRKLLPPRALSVLSPIPRVEIYPWSVGIEGTLTPAPNSSKLAIEQKLQVNGEATTPGMSYTALLEGAFQMRKALIAHMALVGETPSSTPGADKLKGQWYVHVSYMVPAALTPDDTNGAGSSLSTPDDIVRSVWHYIQMNVEELMRTYQRLAPRAQLQAPRKDYYSAFGLSDVEEYRRVGYTGAYLDSFILSLGAGFEELRREVLRERNGQELLRKHRMAAFAAGKK